MKRYFIDKIPVSDLCDMHKIHPTQFYTWQKQLFENAAVAFERKQNSANKRRQQDAQQTKIDQLEEKLQNKNEVVAELLEEHIKSKTTSGGL